MIIGFTDCSFLLLIFYIGKYVYSREVWESCIGFGVFTLGRLGSIGRDFGVLGEIWEYWGRVFGELAVRVALSCEFD